MTREHDALRDLIAPVALGAGEPHEIARVEAHAAGCAVCREELGSLRAGADLLAVAVPQMDPPADLKASLMATVRAEAPARAITAGVGAGAEPDAAPPRPAPPRRSWFAGLLRPWPAFAAVATVAALLLGWNIALQTGSDDPSRPVSTLAVSGTAAAPGVTGRVLYIPDEDTAVVSLSRLPQLEEGDAYQLWVIRDGRPTSAGLFEQSGPAQARTVATGLAGADALAVTAQPRTSRTAPEGPILVEAAVQVG